MPPKNYLVVPGQPLPAADVDLGVGRVVVAVVGLAVAAAHVRVVYVESTILAKFVFQKMTFRACAPASEATPYSSA